MSRGMYFEEFEVGQQIVTSGRTISEADVMAFAGLSGDHTAIHTDAEFARTTHFGKRVAHGLLCLSIASGLATRTGFIEGTVLAFREINQWKFTRPAFLGDTIHVTLDIVDTKPLPRLGAGAVTIRLEVLNQQEETVMHGRWIVLMQSRPESEEA